MILTGAVIASLQQAVEAADVCRAREIVNQVSPSDLTASCPSLQAHYRPWMELVRRVLDVPATDAQCHGTDGKSLLAFSVARPSLEYLYRKMLPNSCEKCKVGALHKAMFHESQTLELLDLGVDVNARWVGITVLQRMVTFCVVGVDMRMVKLFLEKGADADAQCNGTAPLCNAIGSAFSVPDDRSVADEVARMLVRYGADIRKARQSVVPEIIRVMQKTDEFMPFAHTEFCKLEKFAESLHKEERDRLMEICIGLKAFDLPDLLVWEIYRCTPVIEAYRVPCERAWKTIVAVTQCPVN